VIEAVGSVDAPDELRSLQNQLGNTLRSLRTQLNRVQSLANAGDLEAAVAATEMLISIEQLRTTIAAIQDAGSAG
jgi:soluble cytochrome b562